MPSELPFQSLICHWHGGACQANKQARRNESFNHSLQLLSNACSIKINPTSILLSFGHSSLEAFLFGVNLKWMVFQLFMEVSEISCEEGSYTDSMLFRLLTKSMFAIRWAETTVSSSAFFNWAVLHELSHALLYNKDFCWMQWCDYSSTFIIGVLSGCSPFQLSWKGKVP